MPRSFPIKVTWYALGGKPASRGFHVIPSAQRFCKRLRDEGFNPQLWVQGELFETEETGQAKAYDPRYEIPF